MHNLYRAGDRIHITNIVPDMRSSSGGPIFMDIDREGDEEIQRDVLESAAAFIQKEYVQKAAKLGISCTFDLVEEARDPRSVGDLILTQLKRQRATLVVMASHKKSPLAQVFLGSVSRYVSEKADVPVILYH